jgi:hypothetical protein
LFPVAPSLGRQIERIAVGRTKMHLAGGITTDAVVGGLLENFVLGELGRRLTWSETDARHFHAQASLMPKLS